MGKAREWYRSGRRWLLRATRRPAVGSIRLGDLARRTPISRDWGFDRGQPIDRFYIERFLASHAMDIRGRVLEASNNDYTLRFGGDRVIQSDVLHPFEGNPRATVIADLTHTVPALQQQFDCIICTQVLHLVYDVRDTLGQLHDWLKPGGVALVTVPGISQISPHDMKLTGDYWRFTNAALERMFGEAFGADRVEVASWGNVLAAVSFLHGIAAEELDEDDLLEVDPQFQLLTTVRAVRGPA
jgi:SAM-dependent methyltransferase